MKVLIIGISVRAFAESAVRADYEVSALDAFGDLDLRARAETYSLRKEFRRPYSPEALYQAGIRIASDAIAYTSNLENHPDILELFEKTHRIIGNTPEAVRKVRSWPVLFSKLRSGGFQVPETFYPGDRFDPGTTHRWLTKPLMSGGGHGVLFREEEEAAGDRRMLQQYIPGKSCSAAFVANGSSAVIIGISEQLVGWGAFGARGFRYCGSILPLPEILEPCDGPAILDQVRQIAAFLTREFRLTGVNGFDFILDRQQRVRLIEVNPRYTASMELIEAAHRISIFRMHAQSVLEGKLPEFAPESLLNPAGFFGKSILFSEKIAVVPENMDWQSIDAGDIPAPDESLQKGSPVCTLRARRPAYDSTVAELIRQSEAVKRRIYA